MKTKGTHRHDFDPHYVMGLLVSGRVPDSDRVLEDACHVIIGLRKDLGSLIKVMEEQIKANQYWLKPERRP
jgi:hypothetical protein